MKRRRHEDDQKNAEWQWLVCREKLEEEEEGSGFAAACELIVFEFLDEVECAKMKRVSKTMKEQLSEQWGHVGQLSRSVTQGLSFAFNRSLGDTCHLMCAMPVHLQLPAGKKVQTTRLDFTYTRVLNDVVRIPETMRGENVSIEEPFVMVGHIRAEKEHNAAVLLLSVHSCGRSQRLNEHAIWPSLVQWRCGEFQAVTAHIWANLLAELQAKISEITPAILDNWQAMVNDMALELNLDLARQ